MGRPVIVAPDVIWALGGSRAVDKLLADAPGSYDCPICGQPGHLGGDGATVMVAVIYHSGAGRRTACLAHADCCGSSVLMVDRRPTVGLGGGKVPAVSWVRPPGAHPAAVLACLPMVRAVWLTPVGDTVDRLTAGLLELGFTLMTYPRAPLPAVAALVARYADGVLHIRGYPEEPIFRIDVDVTQPWWATATRTGEVGLVVATRVRAPDRDNCAAQLIEAVSAGAVVGARIRLLPPAVDSCPSPGR